VIGRWRPLITGRLPLAFACVSILLIGAATGCSGSPAPPGPGASSPAGGQPATARAGAAPAWGAAAHLSHSQAGEDPTSVSCPSARFCVAVLESGYAAVYDGTRWSQPTGLSSSAGEPGSVSCPTVSFCMAVDARDSSAFLFNGSTWSSAPRINDPVSDTQMGMASVSCSSPSFCAAVDNGSNAFTFNGTSWSPATAIDPGNELSTVSCPSASFCAAVGYGPNVLTFNGSAWSAPVNADPNGLTMGEGGIFWPVVSCPASDFCAAVDGAGGNVVTFDGSTWTAPVTVDSKAAKSVSGPVLMFLMSVSCRSATFCVAGDSTGDVFVRS